MNWVDFLEKFDKSVQAIDPRYFRINVYPRKVDSAHEVWRERAYCYELYHQLRNKLGDKFPYTFHGEIDKRGHEDILKYFESIVYPDFALHIPNTSDNFVVLEVKSSTCDRKDAQKDIKNLEIFLDEDKVGYKYGIFLIFGNVDSIGNEMHENNMSKFINGLEINSKLARKLWVLWHKEYGQPPEVIEWTPQRQKPQ